MVTFMRELYSYPNEKDFRKDALLMTPACRLRARDDLTAPHVQFYSKADVIQLADTVGLSLFKEYPDFSIWLSPEQSLDFDPHALSFSKNHINYSSLKKVGSKEQPFGTDLEIVNQMLQSIANNNDLSLGQRKSIAIVILTIW